MSERPEWFAPKRYGFGAGLPIRWQGWAVTAAFLAVVLSLAWFLEDSQPMAMGSLVLLATLVFLVITARTTRGGWRWRWGSEE